MLIKPVVVSVAFHSASDEYRRTAKFIDIELADENIKPIVELLEEALCKSKNNESLSDLEMKAVFAFNQKAFIDLFSEL